MWRVLGLDLSLSATGVAVLQNNKSVVHLDCIRTAPKDGSHIERASYISSHIVEIYNKYRPQLIVIEEYAYSRYTHMSTLGELGGIVKYELWGASGVPNCWITIGSTACKKHTTGSGGASKQDMIEAMAEYFPDKYRSLMWDDNVADAMALARMGIDKYGAAVVRSQ